MKFPKSLIIGGIRWTVVFDKKVNGGEFNWHKHCIKIGSSHSEERQFNILLHEVSEIIFVNNNMRYKKCIEEVHNGDYLFSFDHDRFQIFIDELSGILKQIMKT